MVYLLFKHIWEENNLNDCPELQELVCFPFQRQGSISYYSTVQYQNLRQILSLL